MRVPVSWLREYVLLDMPLAELATRLSIASAEVEGIERRGVAAFTVAAASARIPAMTLLVAVALLAAASIPTWAPAIGWSALALTFALGELGRTVGLPDRVIQLSPFAHVPNLPGGEWAWTPVLVTTAVAAATTAWFRYSNVSPGACDDSFGIRTPSSGGASALISFFHSAGTVPSVRSLALPPKVRSVIVRIRAASISPR